MGSISLSSIKGTAEGLVETNERNKRQVQSLQSQVNMQQQIMSQSRITANSANVAHNRAVAELQRRSAEVERNNDSDDSNGSEYVEDIYYREVERTREDLKIALNNLKRNTLMYEQATIQLEKDKENLENSRNELLNTTAEIESIIDNINLSKSNASALLGMEHSNNIEYFISKLDLSGREAVDLLNKVLTSLGLDGVAYSDSTMDGNSSGRGARVKTLRPTSGPHHNTYGADGFASEIFSETVGAYSRNPNTQGVVTVSDLSLSLTPIQRLSNYMNENNYSREDYDLYSKDPKWRDLHRNAFPDLYQRKIKESTNDIALSQSWNRYNIPPTIDTLLTKSNPNYSRSSPSYSYNCQRCVPTYELMKRGYDVTAKPIMSSYDHLAQSPYDVWKDPVIFSAKGSGKEDICKKMSEWGDGARAQVVVYWNNGTGGHTFVAEQKNGHTIFIDPQTGDINCERYFNDVVFGETSFCRTDNVEFSNNILECCKGVK